MFIKQKPKIAFVIHGLSMGGAEKFLIYLVNRLLEKDYESLIISLSNDKTLLHEVNPNVRVITVLRKHKFDISIVSRIRRIIIAEEVCQVFCINMFSFFLTKLGFLFNKSIQFYLSLHSTSPVSRKNHFANMLYFRLVQKRDIVIYICKNQQQYLKKNYATQSLHDLVIYNGIDTSYFNPKKVIQFNSEALRNEFGIKPDDLLILQVARLRIEKGHADAIEALYLLHSQFKLNAHLLFVGNGDHEFILFLKKQAKEKGLDKHIHFSGIQSDVRKFYLTSNIFTLTSQSIETFSSAALEAMSFSLPCSLTDIGGANEMIVEGINGYLSKPHDPISIAESWNKLLTENIERQRIRELVLENFTSKKMLDQYLRLFESYNTYYNN